MRERERERLVEGVSEKETNRQKNPVFLAFKYYYYYYYF